MATTLTRNLKLRLDSNLTANAKYNLERIDLLGATFLVDTNDGLNIRSEADISIEPESADIGGSGAGGTVSIGNPSHSLTSFSVYASTINLSTPPGLLDQATGGDKYLYIQYKSDLNGSVDTVANRNLYIDLDGADRSLILGGNFTVTGGDLVLSLPGNSSLILPLTGTLATLAGTETLSNKSLTSPTITGTLSIRDSGVNSVGIVSPTVLPSSYTLQLPSDDGLPNQVLQTDGTGILSWATVAGTASVEGAAATWLTADGLTKSFTHGLASTDIDVSVIDLSTNEFIEIDSVVITDSNNIILTASEAPASSWRVIVQANS